MDAAVRRYSVTWTIGAGAGQQVGHVYLPAGTSPANVRTKGRNYNTVTNGHALPTITSEQLSVTKKGATRDISLMSSTYTTKSWGGRMPVWCGERCACARFWSRATVVQLAAKRFARFAVAYLDKQAA